MHRRRRASELLCDATEADSQHDYPTALRQYSRGVEILLFCCKCEPRSVSEAGPRPHLVTAAAAVRDDMMKKEIRCKAGAFLTRAEQIKAAINGDAAIRAATFEPGEGFAKTNASSTDRSIAEKFGIAWYASLLSFRTCCFSRSSRVMSGTT